jgi:DNA-binding LytR/AlgR family response regulator
MIRLAICDDDFIFAERFKHIFQEKWKNIVNNKPEELEIIYYPDADTVLENAVKVPIDIYFMDIEFGNVSGFALARQLSEIKDNVGIVYITNYENYVTEAFVCRPIGFIRKDDLEQEVALSMREIMNYLEKKYAVISVKCGSQNIEVHLNEVIAVEVYNHEMIIIFKDEQITIHESLSNLENTLSQNGFVKISRSRMVNFKYIREFGKKEVDMYGGYTFTVSEDRIKVAKQIWLKYRMRH